MSQWNLVFSISRNFPVDPISIPIVLSHPTPIIRASFNQGQPSWRKAGWMIPIMEVEGIGRVNGPWQKIWFGTAAVRFENLNLPFQLEFRSVGYLRDINLFVWERSTQISPESSIEFL
jgi:hypothetical protein